MVFWKTGEGVLGWSRFRGQELIPASVLVLKALHGVILVDLAPVLPWGTRP